MIMMNIGSAKFYFILQSILIVFFELIITILPNNTFSWIVRIILIIFIFKIYQILFRKSSVTSIHFFENMILINILLIGIGLNYYFGLVVSHIFHWIVYTIIFSLYVMINYEIKKMNKLIDEGFHPYYEHEVYLKEWYKDLKKK